MRLPLLPVVLFACSAVVGQQPEPKPDPRVEQRSQSMRDSIGSGRPVQSHVRVMVRLKNGNKLNGVVKDGRLVERVDGLRFVDAQASDRGAGIRLWYSGNGRNYVFVPFADFAEYEVLQRLSPKQLTDLEHEMQIEEKRAMPEPVKGKTDAELAEQAKAAAGSTPPAPAAEGQQPAGNGSSTTGTAGTGVAGTAGTGVAGADKEQQQKWFELLQAYPPKAGWNQQKRDEIARRFVVIGAKPSESEQRFVDQFAEWQKACAYFHAESKDAPKDGEEPAPTETGKSKRSRGKATGSTGGSGTGSGSGSGSSSGSEESADTGSGRSRRRKQ